MAGGARKGLAHRPMGAGSVSRTVDRRGYVTYRVRAMRDGVVHRGRSVGLRRGMTESAAQRQAERNLRDLLRRLDAGETPEPERDRATLDGWLAIWRPLKRDALPAETTTWGVYERALRLHVSPFLGHRKLVALRPRHVAEWRAQLRDAGRSAGTIRAAESLLRRVLKDARAQEYPVSGAVLAMTPLVVERRGTEERPYLSAAQLLRLCGVAPEPWRTAWRTAFSGALRFGELAGLRWRHVLWTAGRLDVREQRDRQGRSRPPKKGSAGQVVVGADALAALRAHLTAERAAGRECGPDDRVFLTPRGEPLSYWLVRRVLKGQVAEAGLDPRIATHAFRHGAGLTAAAAEAPLLGLRDQMRHRDLATTSIYLEHRDESGQAEAAARLARRLREAE